MQIDYNFTDAQRLEQAFSRLPYNNSRAARDIRAAYVYGLRLCGVCCAHIESGKVHALRVYAPDGQDFKTV